MKTKTLGQEIKSEYFKPISSRQSSTEVGADEGSKEIKKLRPFVISGGENTELYYFKYVSRYTDYKLQVKPEYFSGESNYTEIFPKKIREILDKNEDAKVFCVFDWDTIYSDKSNSALKLKKHKEFLKQFKEEIDNGTVTVCESMPCIEYWFLLHFVNYTKLLKNYSKVSMILAPHLKPCFPAELQRIGFKKLIKNNKYVSNPMWVINLCSDGKLDNAITRAEENITTAVNENDLKNQSYSYVYKLFKEAHS